MKFLLGFNLWTIDLENKKRKILMLDESLAANEILSYQPFDCDVQIDTVINIEGKEKQLEQCTKER